MCTPGYDDADGDDFYDDNNNDDDDDDIGNDDRISGPNDARLLLLESHHDVQTWSLS